MPQYGAQQTVYTTGYGGYASQQQSYPGAGMCGYNTGYNAYAN